MLNELNRSNKENLSQNKYALLKTNIYFYKTLHISKPESYQQARTNKIVTPMKENSPLQLHIYYNYINV